MSNDTLREAFPTAYARLGEDEDLLREIAKIFLDDSPALVVEIKEACTAGDLEKVAHSAHKLKGLTANIHDDAAALAIQPIVDAARSGSQRQTERTVAQLDQQIATLHDQLVRLM